MDRKRIVAASGFLALALIALFFAMKASTTPPEINVSVAPGVNARTEDEPEPH